MWRVVVPLVIALIGVTPEPTPTGEPTVAPTLTRELLYVQAGWVTGLSSGRLYEGTSPTRCADGSIVYTREGDLWRDGERITSTAEEERNPSCVVDILYEVDGYIWRMSGTSRVRLWEGTDPALHPSGKIAYVDRFQGIRTVYIRDGEEIVIPYKTRDTGNPSWGGRRSVHGQAQLGLVRRDDALVGVFWGLPLLDSGWGVLCVGGGVPERAAVGHLQGWGGGHRGRDAPGVVNDVI
jgi:hypothetical protein